MDKQSIRINNYIEFMNTVFKDKVKGKDVRIVYIEDFIDDGYIITRANAAYQVQVRKRFLWIKYWSILKTYKFNNHFDNVGRIQLVNAKKFINTLKNK